MNFIYLNKIHEKELVYKTKYRRFFFLTSLLWVKAFQLYTNFLLKKRKKRNYTHKSLIKSCL